MKGYDEYQKGLDSIEHGTIFSIIGLGLLGAGRLPWWVWIIGLVIVCL